MGQADYLRDCTDAELAAVAAEAEARDVGAQTRQAINDELRRRQLPTISPAKRRWD